VVEVVAEAAAEAVVEAAAVAEDADTKT